MPPSSGVIGGSVPARLDQPGYLPVYRELAQRGELTAHVAAYPVVQPDLGSQQIDVVEALRAKFKDIPNLTIPGLKVFADGVVEIPLADRRAHQAVRQQRPPRHPAVHAGRR